MRRIRLFSLAILLLLGAAVGLSALGLDVELKGGGGMAMGTTDDSNKSGELRYALDAGLSLDLYLLELGRLSLGLSGGAGYANLNYHGVDNGITSPDNDDPDLRFYLQLCPVPGCVVGKLGVGRSSLSHRCGPAALPDTSCPERRTSATTVELAVFWKW